MGHPENSKELNELIDYVEKQEVIDVWCKGCEMYRVANSAYAKYLKGEIESCRFCRGND